MKNIKGFGYFFKYEDAERKKCMEVQEDITILPTLKGHFLPAPLRFSSCTPTFFFLHLHNVMQRQKYLYYFLKILKYT